MIVEKRHLDGYVLIRVEGVIRMGESASFFAHTLDRTLTIDKGHVLIDLSGIDLIDSTGLGELVGYLGRFRERRRQLALIQPAERTLRLLEVARLDQVFPIYDSVDVAVVDLGIAAENSTSSTEGSSEDSSPEPKKARPLGDPT